MSDFKKWFEGYLAPGNQAWRMDDYETQGIITRIHSSNSIISDANKDFIQAFHLTQNSASADINFFLAETKAKIEPTIIPSTAELLCDLSFLQYFQDGSHRYLHIPGSAMVAADLNNNTAYGIISEATQDDSWLLSHIIFYPMWAQMIKSRSLFTLHAAGIIINEHLVLFPASSGAGKTTLSFILLKEGYKLLGDDTLLLHANNGAVSALGLPESISFRKTVFEIFPELESSKNLIFGKRQTRIQLDASREYPGCFIEKAVPRLIVFPQLTDKPESRFEPIDKADALQLLFGSSIFFIDRSSSGDHLQLLTSLLAQTACFRLFTGRDNRNLIDTLEFMVNTIGETCIQQQVS
jgi:hypothetical protein